VAEPKDWRPSNWDEIKDKILHNVKVVSSPIANELIEETASEGLEAYDREQFAEDAESYCLEMGWTAPK